MAYGIDGCVCHSHRSPGACVVIEVIHFTGKRIKAFNREINATCEVRNEQNKERKPHQVVITQGQTVPHGAPYQPRKFPPGQWAITRVVDMGIGTEYWPVFMDTAASQKVRVWDLDEEGNYYGPLLKWITGRGYGIHHARWNPGGGYRASRTTLGCINILSPDDAMWLGGRVRDAVGEGLRVYIDVPPWDVWEV